MSDAAEREIAKLREQLRQHHLLFAAAIVSSGGELLVKDSAVSKVGPTSRVTRIRDDESKAERFTVTI